MHLFHVYSPFPFCSDDRYDFRRTYSQGLLICSPPLYPFQSRLKKAFCQGQKIRPRLPGAKEVEAQCAFYNSSPENAQTEMARVKTTIPSMAIGTPKGIIRVTTRTSHRPSRYHLAHRYAAVSRRLTIRYNASQTISLPPSGFAMYVQSSKAYYHTRG